MADPQHLGILNQGVEAWNEWRRKYLGIRIDLSGSDLRGVYLHQADLSSANLHGADLRNANLSFAKLYHTNLSYVNLYHANLHNADLRDANLYHADLSSTNLRDADLRDTNLNTANLNSADLYYVDLSGARLWYTIIGDVDLSTVEGLGTVQHLRPSTIGIDTIYRSQGKIPEIFLRGAGVPDSIIKMIPSLVGSLSPIDYHSCFISYSSKDQAFAERLYTDLQSKGVRCWFAPHDMRIGDEIRPRIDESIRVHDKLLLVLSESSLGSTWVKKEVETAFEKEARMKKLVLFPVRLDDAVMQTSQAWAADIRRMRHIGDFTSWRDHDAYQIAFTRLLRDLHFSS